MAISITRKAFPSVSLSSFFIIIVVLQTCFAAENYVCNKDEHDSLLSFHRQISPSLNWSSYNCCNWEGVGCDAKNRVNSLWLPSRGLSGIISSSLGNLSFLSYLNLSDNKLSGPFPDGFFRSLDRLEVLDLSYNSLYGNVLEAVELSDSLPVSIKTVNLSSNHFNGSLDSSSFQRASNLLVFNISNNSFAGEIPSFICKDASLIEVVDFSMNGFSGEISHGFGGCFNLKVFRAGVNGLSGRIPYDLFKRTLKEISLPSNQFSGPIDYIQMARLTNLTTLELHFNQLTGEIPKDIGSLTSLEKLQLHTNNFTGSLPPSLMNCTRLKVLLLRNNKLEGELSSLDFSKLQQLESIDLANNNFSGSFPPSLCRCTSLAAVRLSYNNLSGQLPPCISKMRYLNHISLSNTFLKNATGALRILMGCKNLTVIFLSRTFHNETLPSDAEMEDLDGFQNLEILTLGGGQFTGQIPNWFSKLKKLKLFNLASNKVTGPIPAWLGSMPDLHVINFTSNRLSGQLPRELGNLTALSSGDPSDDFMYLALPFFFSTNEYNRLFNLKKGLKFDGNNLSGSIPVELGRLKQLQILDLNDNNLSGNIPEELSNLANLETLDLSGNHLTGKIPASLRNLNFLSKFSVASNDLQGEIPSGGQFDTFPASSFEGNPRLCGYLIRKNCSSNVTPTEKANEEEDSDDDTWFDSPIWIGFLVGFAGVCVTLLFHKSWRRAYFDFLIRLKDKIICASTTRRVQSQIVQQHHLSSY